MKRPVFFTRSLLIAAMLMTGAWAAHAAEMTPLAHLLGESVKQAPYDPHASHPGVQWANGKDAGLETEGTIQLPGALGQPTMQAVLTVERDTQGRITSVGVWMPPAERQKPSIQFLQILRQQLEPGVAVTLMADHCSWDEGGMEPWSKDVFMRLTWPSGQGSLFAHGRLEAWPDASSSATYSAFVFDSEDPSDLIKQMGCRRSQPKAGVTAHSAVSAAASCSKSRSTATSRSGA